MYIIVIKANPLILLLKLKFFVRKVENLELLIIYNLNISFN